MSGAPSGNQYAAYTPRKHRIARPDGTGPKPVVDDDVNAIEAYEDAQQFTSPPSPPRSSAQLPPKPAPLGPSATTATASSGGDGTSNPSATSDPMPPGAKRSAAVLHPYTNALPTTDANVPDTLTPLRAHYLKKTLVGLQMGHELNLITDPILGANALGLLGDPFVLPESAKREALSRVSEIARQEGALGDLPFMRFLFHQFLLPFPFLTSAPPTFWSAKVQPFLSSFLATTGVGAHATLSKEERDIAESHMTREEKKESEERTKLWNKVEKMSSLMVAVGIRVVGGEEVVRIGQQDLRRLEEQQEMRRKRWAESRKAEMEAAGGGVMFEVNVIGVRVVSEKGRVRSKHHDEFIVRTRRSGFPDVFVSRRYGDFKRLADELRLAFPDYPLPAPPPKDKSAAAAPVVQQPTGYSYYNPLRMVYGSGVPAAPPSPTPSSGTPPGSAASSAASPDPTTATSPLAREKNRLTLRAYLQTILSLPFALNSPILRSFLLSSPTTLTPPEAADCQRRLEGDAVREEGRRRFREEAEKRIEGLREGLAQFKGDMLAKEGGLKKVFEVVRRVERVEDLPKAESAVVEWGRISLAATIFQLFVASDTASDTLAALKRIHGLMPYFVLKGILRISNPMAMIRGVLDLFLARPFGGQSLLQRMFSANLTDDVRMIAEDIAIVQEKVDDPVMCQKIEQYATAPFEIQEFYRKDAVEEGVDLLTVILRAPDAPSLSRPQMQRASRASRAYRTYKAAQAELSDSDDDLGPEDEEAWLYEDLNVLLRLWMRKREKEALVALIFEGVTAELLKDIITIFYTPLAQVYKAASIADSVGDLQNFLNDMIRTVEQVEELQQEDPARTVQTFIDLVQRHEQAFYTFVHNVHSKGSGLFDSLMGWIELFLSFARDGLPEPIDLDFILPAGGPERKKVMQEVDAVAQYHYRLKVAHEEKIRRRFRREAAGEEEAALLDSVMASLSLSETAMAEGGEAGDDDSDADDEAGGADSDDDESGFAAFDAAAAGEKSEAGAIRIKAPALASDSPVEPMSAVAAAESKSRRGSNVSAGRVSLDKIRNTLRPSHDSERPKADTLAVPSPLGTGTTVPGPSAPPSASGSFKPLPPPPTSAAITGSGHMRAPPLPLNRQPRKKQKRLLEMMNPPETKAIEELRPLFVEMIKPMLRVKKISA